MRIGMGAVILVAIVMQFVADDAQVSVWLLVAGLAVLLYLHHALTVRVDLGKRYTGAGWMFRVSGVSTVDVTRSSSSFRIGTDDPDGRLAAIDEAMAARRDVASQDDASR